MLLRKRGLVPPCVLLLTLCTCVCASPYLPAGAEDDPADERGAAPGLWQSSLSWLRGPREEDKATPRAWMMPMYYGLIGSGDEHESSHGHRQRMLRSLDWITNKEIRSVRRKGAGRRRATTTSSLPEGFRPGANPWVIWRQWGREQEQ